MCHEELRLRQTRWKANAPLADHPFGCPHRSVESSQEGSETGGEWRRADGETTFEREAVRPTGTVAIWRSNLGIPWFVPLAVEQAISRDAEERARAPLNRAEMALIHEQAATRAAEERATQAEVQQEALETVYAVNQDADWCRFCERVSGHDDECPMPAVERALSPSTEAPSVSISHGEHDWFTVEGSTVECSICGVQAIKAAGDEPSIGVELEDEDWMNTPLGKRTESPSEEK